MQDMCQIDDLWKIWEWLRVQNDLSITWINKKSRKCKIWLSICKNKKKDKKTNEILILIYIHSVHLRVTLYFSTRYSYKCISLFTCHSYWYIFMSTSHSYKYLWILYAKIFYLYIKKVILLFITFSKIIIY